MTRLLISLSVFFFFVCLSEALQDKNFIVKGSLYRDKVNLFGYANFVKYENVYLNVASVALSGFVRKAGECAFICANSSVCYSFNFAVSPDIHGRHVCEILATDKYNASVNFTCKAGFNHYSLYSPCSSSPCYNGATCKAIYEHNKYECVCKPGYSGLLCQDAIEADVGLIGHSYKNVTSATMTQCSSLCLNDCRCVSCQLFGTRCELLDEDRYTAPADFVSRPGYKYTNQLKPQTNTIEGHPLDCIAMATSTTSAPTMTSSSCSNGCCQNITCLNGGTCIEQCGDVRPKFKCLCVPGVFTGRMCEKPMTCAAHGKGLVSGLYPITLPSGDNIQVYCDFQSQPGFVWTLIESFAFANMLKYQSKSFVRDFPVNQDNHNWADYRLSRLVMLHIRNSSSLFRATCKYDTDGLVMRDYIRGLLTNYDIIMYASGTKCAHVQYINVRGITCSECTTHLRQVTYGHAHVNSGFGANIGCQWDGRQGMLTRTQGNSIYFDLNFGFYSDPVNPAHRCSSSPSSTTQWWLGTPE